MEGDSQALPSFEDILAPIKIFFSIVGIPFNAYRGPIKFLIMTGLIYGLVGMEIVYFIKSIDRDNFKELTALAPCINIGILTMVKAHCVFRKKNKLFKLCSDFSVLYDGVRGDRIKLDAIHAEVYFLKRLIKYYINVNVALMVVYNFKDVIYNVYHYWKYSEIDYTLPYALSLPFAVDSILRWIIVDFYCIVGVMATLIHVVAYDGVYYILTSYLCMHMSILSHELVHLQPENFDNLQQIVKRHQHLVSISEDLEHIFSVPNFSNYLSASAQICLLGFNITVAELHEIPQFIAFLVSSVVQILLLSFFGENLIIESQRIGQSAFFSRWRDMNREQRRIILIICERAKRPLTLTAYKFSVISYRSFTRIMSTSWSYFTILNTVYRH